MFSVNFNGGLLVDAGFFIALYDSRDAHHEEAVRNQDYLNLLLTVLPWPVLCETVNTRFSRRREIMAKLDHTFTSENASLIDDRPYREACYRRVMGRQQPELSLVDAVLHSVIEDTNVRISAMLTFNMRDFSAICRRHSVELLCNHAGGQP